VLSRCQRHEFRRIPLNFIQAQLKEIAEKEGIHVEPAALTAIARQATGSMRDAVSLLDQLASTGSDVTLELTQQVLGTAASLSVMDLIEAILQEKTGTGMAIINRALDGGSDPRQLGRQMVDTLRAILMVKMGNADQLEATTEEAQKLKEFSSRIDLQRLLAAIRSFDQAAQHTNVGWQPGLQLELALARAIEMETDVKTAEPKKQTEKERPLPAQAKPTRQAASETPTQQIRPSTQKPEVAVQKKSETPLHETSSVEKPRNDAPTAEPGGSGGADAIKEKWREIRYKAKEISPETGALLNSCRTMEVIKGKLVLSFSGQMLCSKMENGRNLDNAREAVKAVTGADLPIECRVAGENDTGHAADPDVEKGGMVGAALSLGAKITKKEKTDE
jgi:DNA polymerase-3 subunit gamma/tau